ncbi:MAG: extracellular solute-binding protein [Chloroflexi bacterium]|nr:extracellular solute-binding protein [Chloroflexota bacterium]MCI0575615.1 extracellular solute-binding protein [Chloroflexota bacterium]MCI0645048.1 extracellular solute-binding protein [Chloroflexota bacterium]MCI0731884.1 extracellular solute-binding protein [Chloroflexota bacterium]
MIELELSLMSHGPGPHPLLQEALHAFEAENDVRVHLRYLAWETGRSELVSFALSKHSPDVSEIGTTWLSSFAAMDALRPFAAAEVANLDFATFIPASWESGAMPGGQIYSIPWMADARSVFYRRDVLAAHGIDEATAFTRPKMQSTLGRLQAAGVAVPWVAATHRTSTIIHNVASWVWDAGGHFMSDDGRRPRFHEPAAKEGIYNYFTYQFPYMPPQAYNLTDDESSAMFLRGEATGTIGGYWILSGVANGQAAAVVVDNLGMTVLPLVPYVGGSNLVVWKYSRHPQAAVRLVKYLTDYQVQANVVRQIGLLPARLDVLGEPPFSTDPRYQVIRQSLLTGRCFKSLYLWGLVEEKLIGAIDALWHELFQDPALDLRKAIDRQIDPIAERLARTLAADN